MSQMMSYDKSPIPPEKSGGNASERNPDRSIRVDDRGGWQYDSASAEGFVETELPSLPGSPNATERLHVRDFGPHVIAKIEAAMQRQPYLTKAGPTQSPSQVFAHYTAVARGAKLMDAAAISRMEVLAKEFSQESEQSEYLSQVLRPYLLALSPARRR
jgi:hypothetical protein